MPPDDHRQQRPPHFWRSRYAIGLVVVGGIAAYFLLAEHRAHIAGALPYLLLLACPLMHFFMHGGHGGHGHHHHQDKPSPDDSGKSDSTKTEDRS